MKRIYHTWEKWECYPAGFYEDKAPEGMTKEECVQKYKGLLSDSKLFGSVLLKIITTWKYSCEHYLSNERMNRIAWLGQAALACAYNIPASFRVGYHLLSNKQKKKADLIALKYLNIWLISRKEKALTLKMAQSKTEPNLY